MAKNSFVAGVTFKSMIFTSFTLQSLKFTNLFLADILPG